ncbi:MAG: hypothetical protein ACI4WT_08330 [Oligosphaeraceae bacterium]
MRKLLLLSALLFLVGCASWSHHDPAQDTLMAQMRHGDSWKQIHAAEALLRCQARPAEMRPLFEARLRESVPGSPWRVGCLRVLYRLCPERREAIAADLLRMALDNTCAGRVHAIETAAKLNLKAGAALLEKLRLLKPEDGLAFGYGLVLRAINGDAEARAQLLQQAEQGDVTAAFGLTLLPETLKPAEHQRVLTAAQQPSLTGRALTFLCQRLHQDGDCREMVTARLTAPLDILLACEAVLTPADRPWLQSLLQSSEPAERIAAAEGLLRLH